MRFSLPDRLVTSLDHTVASALRVAVRATICTRLSVNYLRQSPNRLPLTYEASTPRDLLLAVGVVLPFRLVGFWSMKSREGQHKTALESTRQVGSWKLAQFFRFTPKGSQTIMQICFKLS